MVRRSNFAGRAVRGRPCRTWRVGSIGFNRRGRAL